eukprot:TRINITY_DN10832_c0_g1_i1.p1 TRINITY_DN10832_c0_g1~~TRINITY_DN10832_c0_g1_i1.p1  ORF type:complete len:1570 (+),score=437.99 TRINITY_DN10832_c0_g1_i1:251-4960(+)
MRNLHLLSVSGSRVSTSPSSKTTCFTYTNERTSGGAGSLSLSPPCGESGTVFYVDESNLEDLRLVGYDLGQSGASQVLDLELCNDDLFSAGSSVVGIKYVPDIDSVCVASKEGDILVYDFNTNMAECVGSIESGVLAMAWSPDYELVVFVTGKRTVICMTQEWDVVNEVSLFDKTFGDGTQNAYHDYWQSDIYTSTMKTHHKSYKITKGHENRHQEGAGEGESESDGATTPTHSLEVVSLTWRGDGEFFACNSAYPPTDGDGGKAVKRCMRVFDRSCTPHSASESAATDNMGSDLHWRPSGSLIASSQVLPNKHEIVFFERNGLRHGQFTLRHHNRRGATQQQHDGKASDLVVLDVRWNASSDLVSVVVKEDQGPEVEAKVYLQIWYRSNYHWFMKYERFLGAGAGVRYSVAWDDEDGMCMRILSSDTNLTVLRFALDYDVMPPLLSGNDNDGDDDKSIPYHPCVIGMIDGSEIKLTPLHHVSIPPPMSASSIRFHCPVTDVAFSSSSSVDMGALLSDSTFVRFQLPDYKRDGAPFGTVATVSARMSLHGTADDTNMRLRQPLLLSDSLLVCIGTTTSSNSSTDTLVVYQLPSSVDGNNTPSLRPLASYPLMSGAVRLVHDQSMLSDSTRSAVASLVDGSVLRVLIDIPPNGDVTDVEFVVEPLSISLRETCECMSTVKMGPRTDDDVTIISLSRRTNTLYIDGAAKFSGCTSFAIHDKFLAYTTLSHHLHFLPLSVRPDAIPNADQKGRTSAKYDTHRRTVERGSILVAAVPHDTKTILQMPRGNLETIFPRALTVAVAQVLIDAQQYGSAFVMLRRQRVDLNLLVDHNLNGFLANLSAVVEQIKTPRFINQLLTSLKEEDVTRTLFFTSYGRSAPVVPEKPAAGAAVPKKDTNVVGGKIGKVCEAVRKVLLARVNSATPVDGEKDEEEVYMASILTTYVRDSPPRFDDALGYVKDLRRRRKAYWSAALDYLVFLSEDVRRLYKVALATYDLKIASMVAHKSQMDPREYSPFFKRLEAMLADGSEDADDAVVDDVSSTSTTTTATTTRLSTGAYFMRYTIDEHLGKHAGAMANLSRCVLSTGLSDMSSAPPLVQERFEQCLQLMRNHSLFDAAVELFSQWDGCPVDVLRSVLNTYGNFLEENERHCEAYLVYARAGSYAHASRCCVASLDWRMALVMARRADVDDDEIKAMASEMAGRLSQQTQYVDAADLLLNHAADADGAIEVLLEGSLWSRAISILAEQRDDAACFDERLQRVVGPAVTSACEICKGKLTSSVREITRLFERLRVVRRGIREVQKTEAAAFYERLAQASTDKDDSVFDNDLDRVDLFSDTSSLVSGTMSQVSSASSFSVISRGGTRRHKKRKKKKGGPRVSGKPGSRYEEEFLVKALIAQAPTNPSAYATEVSELVQAAYLLGLFESANAVQKGYTEFVKALNDSSGETSQQLLISAAADEWREDEMFRILTAEEAATGGGPANKNSNNNNDTPHPSAVFSASPLLSAAVLASVSSSVAAGTTRGCAQGIPPSVLLGSMPAHLLTTFSTPPQPVVKLVPEENKGVLAMLHRTTKE